MVVLVDREEVFLKSSIVDHCISNEQKFWYGQCGNNLEGYIEEKSIPADGPYDHLEPFHNNKEIFDDFAVLSFTGKNKPDYLAHRSIAFIRFFSLLNIMHLYLLDELKLDWIQFPFSYREKREVLKSIVHQPSYSEAFQLEIDDLSVILPLFHNSGRNSTPIIWFFPVNDQVPLAMFLCDDANLHTSFLERDREKLASAASAAGLIMGGLEVCRL